MITTPTTSSHRAPAGVTTLVVWKYALGQRWWLGRGAAAAAGLGRLGPQHQLAPGVLLLQGAVGSPDVVKREYPGDRHLEVAGRG